MGGTIGGTDARRWSASYSRDPVVMIVMSVRAASRDALWRVVRPREVPLSVSVFLAYSHLARSVI